MTTQPRHARRDYNRPWIGLAAAALSGVVIGTIAGVGIGLAWVITGVGR